MENEYRVRWEIDITASSPREAAERALEIHRKQDSIATVFGVWPHGNEAAVETFDLTPQHALDAEEW